MIFEISLFCIYLFFVIVAKYQGDYLKLVMGTCLFSDRCPVRAHEALPFSDEVPVFLARLAVILPLPG
jgi:hypothetical protein